VREQSLLLVLLLPQLLLLLPQLHPGRRLLLLPQLHPG